MKKPFLLIVLAFVISLPSHAQEECPIEFGNEDYMDKVTELILEAPSCYEASNLVNACSMGASGDAYMVGVTIKKCEKEIPKMSQKDSELYFELNAKCDKKYSKMRGTMYISMNAFCHLPVTQLFIEWLRVEK